MLRDVQAFFTSWEIYRLCIEHNTLHHREVGAILAAKLAARSRPFDFLDLACGDAQTSAAALVGTAVKSYTGIDFSAPALELAQVNTASLGCAREFLEEDFTSFLDARARDFDVIYLGLSLHHLEMPGKRQAMRGLRAATRDAGTLYMYEPVLAAGESRETCLERWHRAMDGPYDAFPPAARDALWEHVRTSDYPETQEEYISAARDAGFPEADVLFTDAGGFYSLFEFRA